MVISKKPFLEKRQNANGVYLLKRDEENVAQEENEESSVEEDKKERQPADGEILDQK